MLKTVYEGKFLRVVEKDGWECVERAKNNFIASILSITKDNKIILVEQFRIPVNKQVIVCPAGLVGDHIKGELLKYDMKLEHFQGSGGDGNGRIRIQLDPEVMPEINPGEEPPANPSLDQTDAQG